MWNLKKMICWTFQNGASHHWADTSSLSLLHFLTSRFQASACSLPTWVPSLLQSITSHLHASRNSPFFSRLLHSLNLFLFFKKKLQSVGYKGNRLGAKHCVKLAWRPTRASLTSPSYLVRNRTLGPPLENNPEIPPSSRDEGLRLLHGLEANLATSLQTPQEA